MAQGDGHDATWRRVGISALTTPLNHSSTGSELASVNSLPYPAACITLIFAKRYEINERMHTLSRFFHHRRPFTLAIATGARYRLSKENR